MSLYATAVRFDGEHHARPLWYRGSHILPRHDHQRAGVVELAHIPGDTVHAIDDTWDAEKVAPYLRLSVNDADVLLDRRQAQQVRDYLDRWLRSVDHGGDLA